MFLWVKKIFPEGFDENNYYTATVLTNPVIDSVTLNIIAIEKIVKESSGSSWKVVSDSIAEWRKDIFDYFIGPKEKTALIIHI